LMLIMAIDPGTKTGTVLAEFHQGNLIPTVIRHDEIDQALELDAVWAFVNRQDEEQLVVVCEAFS